MPTLSLPAVPSSSSQVAISLEELPQAARPTIMHSARSSAVSFFAILFSFFLIFSIAILYVRSDYARILFFVMRVVKG